MLGEKGTNKFTFTHVFSLAAFVVGGGNDDGIIFNWKC
jgi:hypothetical protein